MQDLLSVPGYFPRGRTAQAWSRKGSYAGSVKCTWEFPRGREHPERWIRKGPFPAGGQDEPVYKGIVNRTWLRPRGANFPQHRVRRSLSGRRRKMSHLVKELLICTCVFPWGAATSRKQGCGRAPIRHRSGRVAGSPTRTRQPASLSFGLVVALVWRQ